MILIAMPQKQEILGEESDQAIRCCYGCKTQVNMHAQDQVSHNIPKKGGGI